MENLSNQPRLEINGQEGLSLKQFIADDAPIIFALINFDREHLSQLDDATAKKYPTVDAVEKSILSPEDPTKLRFGIYSDDLMVGSINLKPTSESSAEIGYWVGAEHIKKGYASRATTTLADYAFNSLGLEKLTAGITNGNEASERTLRKNGFEQVGLNLDGGGIVFELTKENLKKRP